MLCASCTHRVSCRKRLRFEAAVDAAYFQAGEVPEEPLTFTTCDGSILVWTSATGISAERCGDYSPAPDGVQESF